MTAYALAQVHSVELGPDILEYLQRIDATLDPFGGRFVVHGGKFRTMEGSWGRDGLILIEFPTTSGPSPGTTRPPTGTSSNLRTRHMTADVIIAEGVPAGHRAAKRLAAPEASGPVAA